MARQDGALAPGSGSPTASHDERGMPRPGATIAGKYVVERVVGRGGMATVYEATHLRLRQRVAIKMLAPRVAAIPEVVHRFEREARALVQLRGPNVAHVHDVDTTAEGLPFIVMELLGGHDLARELDERKGEIPIAEAVGYVLQACTAMAEAHALGIIHRDLKPANLFLTGAPLDRVVKVIDFGVSKILEGDTAVTATAVVLGTPMYMAPEQIESARGVDARADIWSLGVILYELLTCELPFGGTGVSGTISSVMKDAPRPLRSRRPDAPSDLVAVVMRALTKDPGARFQRVAELAEALVPFGPPGAWKAPEPPARDATGGVSTPPPEPHASPDHESTVRSERAPARASESESSAQASHVATRRPGGWKLACALIVAAIVVLAVIRAIWR